MLTGFSLLLLIFSSISAHAVRTENMEILFQKTNWREDSDVFGMAIFNAGDMNQDAYEDIMIAVREYHPEACSDSCFWGRVYLFNGGSPMDTILDWSWVGGRGNGGGLQSLTSADLNGDGWRDVIFGESYADVVDTLSWAFGTVRIFFGGSTLDSLPNLILDGLFADEPGPLGPGRFGNSVSTGDLNGDGYEDLVVGDPNAENGGFPAGLDGRVYIYWGGPGFHANSSDMTLYGSNEEHFGESVGSGGDLNSDGFEDLVVGAPDNSELYFWGGKIYIYFGGNPMDTIADLWMYGEEPGNFLGEANVSILKNETDYDRVLTGTYAWSSPARGKVYVLNGGNPMDNIPDVELLGKEGSGFGIWSSSAGEVNTSVYEDFIVGAPWEEASRGVIYFYFGDSPLDTLYDAKMIGRYDYPSTGRGDYIGYKVASAGDVDGDGLDEVMVSNYPSDSLKTVWVLKYLPLGVEEEVHKSPYIIKLFQNYPNPFQNSTLIQYQIPMSNDKSQMTNIHLTIYDITGRLVVTLVNEPQESGVYQLPISNHQLPGSGVYFYRLNVGANGRSPSYTQTRKMILLR